jgi:hypothetical protein
MSSRDRVRRALRDRRKPASAAALAELDAALAMLEVEVEAALATATPEEQTELIADLEQLVIDLHDITGHGPATSATRRN